MNAKKVILGSLVLVFAVGSAIASDVLLNPVFLKAIVLNEEGQQEERCLEIDANCNEVGPQICRVTVSTSMGPQTARAYRNDSCSSIVDNNTGTVNGTSEETIISLVEAE